MIIQQEIPTNARIAVIGAGASGLTAAYTLKQLGYPHVTVYEKAAMPGGKVLTDRSLGVNIELGAVFATEDYEVTLQLASELGSPTIKVELDEQILDEDGALVPALQFATRKYGPAQLQLAVERYTALCDKYRLWERHGFAGLPAELHMPFAEFAEKYEIVPVADLCRCQFVAYGLPYYETVPAMYYLKGLDIVLKIGPAGIRRPIYFFFSNGFQDLWVRLAKQLDVHCSSEITAVQRSASVSGPKIEIMVNGEQKVCDYVIIATPPSATKRFLDLSAEERDLFNHVVSRNYHVTVAAVDGVAEDRRAVLFYAYTRPEAIGHVNCWFGPDPARPVFVAWQNVAWSQSEDEARQLLASDFATLGGGTMQGVLLHQAWDNFAHVETAALNAGFYDRFEALQGKNGTLYATGLLASTGVEFTARYARDLVKQFFASAAVSRQGAARVA
jgi:protoporphyrinogen/coproporphyrinogen III oxidase